MAKSNKRNQKLTQQAAHTGNFYNIAMNDDSLAAIAKEDEKFFTGEQIDLKKSAQETIDWLEGDSHTVAVTEPEKSNEPTDALDMLKTLFHK